MKRLSVIVPVYNVGIYLERCLRSLEDQDINGDEYEIICVNDGSTDNSRDKVILMQREFKNIILIDQQNQGVSAARNKGIDIAIGEYLLMVDPDDFIKSNSLGERLKILTNTNIDVGYNGHSVLNEDMNEEYRFDLSFDADRIITGIDFYNIYIKNRSDLRVPHISLGIFFRADFLNSYNLRYLEGVPYLEDGEFMAKINCLAERLVFIKGSIYMKIVRLGSAMNSKLYHSKKARNGFLKAANDLFHFRINYCKTEEQKIFMNQPIVQFTVVYLISHEGLGCLKHYSELYEALKKGPLKILQTQGCSDFYKKMGESYNHSINYFYLNWFIYKIRKSFVIRANMFLGYDFLKRNK